MINPRVIRYIAVGGVSYLAEISCLYVLHQFLGLSPIKSVAISFWIGFIVAFVLQKLVTFRNRSGVAHLLARQLFFYGLLTLWNYGFTLLVTKLLSPTLSVVIIRTAVILVITTWNYAVYKVIFNEHLAHTNHDTHKAI